MSQMTFSHLLSLSLSFHTKRKTGEILRILDRGAAINRVFELLLFSICPTFVDIAVALGVFVWKFGWELALVVALVMTSYSEYFYAIQRMHEQSADPSSIVVVSVSTIC
jgi:ATP-binding cassette subfamily B (MDR/TAP) protein 6